MSAAYFVKPSEFPLFTLKSVLSEVQHFLSQQDWSHIPVVDGDAKWIGNLLSEDIVEADPDLTIEDILYEMETFYIIEEYMSLQYFDIFAKYESNIIPWLNEYGNIVAVIVKKLVLQQWSNIDFINNSGVSIIVETETLNFSFSQICQIIEGNNAKLFGIIQLNNDHNIIQLLFRTNGINSKIILNDLRRFDYNILSKHIEDTHHTDLVEKSTYLTKFLNI